MSKKNVLILTTDVVLTEELQIICSMLGHSSMAATRGDVGYAILERWSPHLIIVGELEDVHAGSVAHTVTMRSDVDPYLLAVHRTFGHELIDKKYAIRCLEMGFDEVAMLPCDLEQVLHWIEHAHKRTIDPWVGECLQQLQQSYNGSSSGSATN